jgi:transcriptional regulator with XRE-family HTH domain
MGIKFNCNFILKSSIIKNIKVNIKLGGFLMLNGKKIRDIRVSLGYTTQDIQNITRNTKFETSISKSYLEELERGDKKNPSLEKVVVIAKILGCKIDDLILSA